MNHPITPLRAALFGVLLVALWLILLGICNALQAPFVILSVRPMGLSVTFVTIFLIALWKILPLGIGIILFRQHRTVVHLFGGIAIPKEVEQDTWNSTPLLATLLIGLLGLLLVTDGLQRFCGEQSVMWLILAIDNPREMQYFPSGNIAITGSIFGGRLPQLMPILYPVALGLVFLLGARQIGNLIGRQIDKSFSISSEEESPEEGGKEGNPL